MTPDIAPASARKPSDVLEAAADLIEPEGAWTRKVAARDADGAECGASSPEAVCWCVEGALYRVGREQWAGAVQRLERSLRVPYVADWNDTRRKSTTVVTALRKAAALARSEGQ